VSEELVSQNNSRFRTLDMDGWLLWILTNIVIRYQRDRRENTTWFTGHLPRNLRLSRAFHFSVIGRNGMTERHTDRDRQTDRQARCNRYNAASCNNGRVSKWRMDIRITTV